MYRRLQKHAPLGLVYLFCVGWLFYPGLAGTEIPGFRDAYHFYYPQAVWLEHCYENGELFPVWNAGEGLGVSVSGQPSAALYYPLRVCWLLPFTTLIQRYSIYMLVHVLLAAAGMGFAARSLRLPRSACWLAAISYSLSCPVIFQHSNLIFLCSAAWIGFAIGSVVRLIGDGRRPIRRTLGFSIACGMMVLAGDPHSAVNTLIIVAVAIVIRALGTFRRSDTSMSVLFQRAAREASLLLLACGFLLVLTAVQWIPTARWASHSSRFATDAKAGVGDPKLAEVLATPVSASHRIHDFSISPWHVATVAWPTIGGHFVPQNSRWFSAIPSEGRMWIPSLYFGVIPCLLVCASFRRAHGAAFWLGVLMLLALLCSLGNYSIVWLLREALHACGFEKFAESLPKDHVGSPYWLLTQLIPGYAGFRYPGKWSAWFVAAASLLAALQYHRLGLARASKLPKTRLLSYRPARLLLIISAIGLSASLLLWFFAPIDTVQEIDRWLARTATDSLLGAPDARAVLVSCCVAFSAPVLVLASSALLGAHSRFLAWTTLIEMTCVASQWMIFAPPPTIPQDLRAPQDALFVWVPPLSDPALLGKLATLDRPRVLNASQSIEPAELTQIKKWLGRRDTLGAEQPELDRVLATLGVTHRLSGVKTGQGLQFARWMPIQDAAPLCQSEGLDAPERNLLTWSWEASGVLSIHATSERPGKLIVRQYNDGGWIVETDGKQRLPDSARLFVEFTIPAGDSEIRLRRRWLW